MNEGHVCTDMCRAWHQRIKPRGMRQNTIPKGDPRHLNDIGKKHAEANAKARKK